MVISLHKIHLLRLMQVLIWSIIHLLDCDEREMHERGPIAVRRTHGPSSRPPWSSPSTVERAIFISSYSTSKIRTMDASQHPSRMGMWQKSQGSACQVNNKEHVSKDK
jgi:hypothetical protein